MIIKRQFDQEMADLEKQVEEMAHFVLRMLELSLEAIPSFDAGRLDRIQKLELKVNRFQMRIDDLVWKIIALYQPTASDLRVLLGSTKIATNLERSGDEICAMCRRAISLANMDWKEEPFEFVELQVMVRSLFKDGLAVLKNQDETFAESIFKADDTIDEEFHQLFDRIRERVKKEPEHVDGLLDILSMARYLERIADLSTNFAEIAVFMKKGKDLRHHGMDFS